MITILRLAAFCAVFTVSAQRPVMAQSLEDQTLDRLAGSWILRGDIGGKAVMHAVEAHWVLAHQYLQLRETSNSRDAKGAPEYDAIVYIGWNPESKRYTCLWLDSTGGNGLVGTAFGIAIPDSVELAFLWSDKNGNPTLRNTLFYDQKDDQWNWQIEDVVQGKFQTFANVRLTRK